MADTFTCPHCDARYPLKPVLIGRAVRCSSCKQPFKLGEDGIALPVGAASQQQSAHSAAAKPAPPEPPPAPPTPAPAADSASQAVPSASSGPAASASSSGRQHATSRRMRSQRSKTLTTEQEALRRRMSANLSDVTNQALESEAVAREQQRADKAETTKRRRRQTGDDKDGSGFGPAVLTGYGEREAKHKRQLFLGLIIAAVVIAGLVFLASGTSPRRQALIDFCAAVPPDQASPLARIDVMRERAWLYHTGMPVIDDIDDATIAGSSSVRLDAAAIATAVGGQAPVPGSDWWAPSGQVDQVATLVAQARGDHAALQRALERAELTPWPAADVLKRLREAGLSAEAAELVALLIAGTTERQGGNWIRDRILAGNPPDAIEVATFHGASDRRILPTPGDKIRTSSVRYRGRLARFVGWTGVAGGHDLERWAVLDLATTNN